MDGGEARQALVNLGKDYDLHEDRHVEGEDPVLAKRRGKPRPLTFYSPGNFLWKRCLWYRGSNGSHIEIGGRRYSWLIELWRGRQWELGPTCLFGDFCYFVRLNGPATLDVFCLAK